MAYFGTKNTMLIGLKGDDGGQGAQGEAATVEVGTTTTGAAGTQASVENVGTESAAILNFTIPRGDAGEAYTLPAATNAALGGVKVAGGGTGIEIKANGFIYGLTMYTTLLHINANEWVNGYCDLQEIEGVTQDTTKCTIFCESDNPAVTCTGQGDSSLEFYCSETPSGLTTIKVVVLTNDH